MLEILGGAVQQGGLGGAVQQDGLGGAVQQGEGVDTGNASG